MKVAVTYLSASIVPCTSPPAVWAAPSDTLTYHLTACSGPPGTPANIDGVKQPHEGAALRLTSMSGNFIFMEASDATTGEVFFSTAGFQHKQLEHEPARWTTRATPASRTSSRGS